MKTKSFAVLLYLLVLSIVFSGADVLAVTVDFTDLDRGPSATLQIDGVTISTGVPVGADVGGMPATIFGVGLGSSIIGSSGTLDRIQSAGGSTRESLTLTVSGTLDSITINPFFSIVGTKEEIFLPFDISLFPAFLGPYHTVFNDSPVTFSLFGLTNSIQVGLQSDFGNPAVLEYLQKHPDATVQFGFAITSLDYTQADVPETSTVMLLVIGLIGFGLLHGKISREAHTVTPLAKNGTRYDKTVRAGQIVRR